MTISFKWKIALNMWILAAVCTIASGALSGWLLIKNHERSIEQQLRGTATILISMGITDYSGLQGFEQLGGFIDSTINTKKLNQIINVYTKRGKQMFNSYPDSEDDFKVLFEPVKAPTYSVFKGVSKKYKVLTTPYVAKNGKDYFLQIAVPYLPYSEIISTTVWQAALLFVVMAILSLVIAQLLARKLVRPVKQIARYVNSLNPKYAREWTPLVLVKPGEYLIDIVAGINSLIVRVKSAMYNVSRTSRYLAHELRNPLTILIGEAESVLGKKDATINDYRDVVKSSVEEVDRMNNVVSTVLKIVEKEKLTYHPVPCNLNTLLDENVKKWEVFLNKNISWEKPAESMIRVVDADLLLQLLDNLVRNIKKHTNTSGCKISLGREPDGTVIKVEDSGPGMDKRLIEALNNNDVMYAGIGIGLVLCLEITSICNFHIVFNNKENGGLVVRIRL